MTMRIATAAWADPAVVEEQYLYRDGTVWLGRSASEGRIPLGYCDDRHVCLVSGSRGGKGTSFNREQFNPLARLNLRRRPEGRKRDHHGRAPGQGSTHCKGMGQTVKVLDPFKAAQVDDSLRGPLQPARHSGPRKRGNHRRSGAHCRRHRRRPRGQPTIRSGMNRRGRWSRGCSCTS